MAKDILGINTDAIPEKDLLGRVAFADSIAKSLKMSFNNGAGSFVFGLNGRWGSGKTVLMTYLKKALKRELSGVESSVMIDFNPWMFSGKDELTSIFFNQLAKELVVFNPDLQEKIGQFGKALSYLKVLKYVNTTLGQNVEAFTDALQKISTKRPIGKLKKSIDNYLVKHNIRLFVFMDDIDRLTPEEIVVVFQIIKLNANFLNTVFIISYDKEVVQEALEIHYQFDDGGKYLEKMIQVDYRIPDPLEETIQEIFFKMLDEFLVRLKVDYDEIQFRTIWIIKRLRFYFVTLRDVHRYFNALKIRFPGIKGQVDVYQFFVIEAIRIFDYSAYERIQRQYKKIIEFGVFNDPTAFLSDFTNANTKELGIFLFEDRFGSKKKNSVADPQHFDRYFALASRRTNVFDETIERFIRAPKYRAYIIQLATLDGSIKFLLNRLKTATIDLGSIIPLTQWKSASESQFIECRSDVIKVLGHIIESNGEFANGLNYLISILGVGSDMNPVHFYLIHYFNEEVHNDTESIFYKHLDVLRNNQAVLKKLELDQLKQQDNNFFLFHRNADRTDFFHILFLKRYHVLLAHEYDQKMRDYLDRNANLFLFMSFLLNPGDGKAPIILQNVTTLISNGVLNIMEEKCGRINQDGLTIWEKQMLSSFLSNKQKIRNIVVKQSIFVR